MSAWSPDGSSADLREEVLRYRYVEAGAVARLAVGVHRTAMPDRLQRLGALQHDLAARLAVDGGDQADAAGVVLLGGIVGVPRLEIRRVAAPVLDEIAHRSLLLRARRTGFRMRPRSGLPYGRRSGRIRV